MLSSANRGALTAARAIAALGLLALLWPLAACGPSDTPPEAAENAPLTDLSGAASTADASPGNSSEGPVITTPTSSEPSTQITLAAEGYAGCARMGESVRLMVQGKRNGMPLDKSVVAVTNAIDDNTNGPILVEVDRAIYGYDRAAVTPETYGAAIAGVCARANRFSFPDNAVPLMMVERIKELSVDPAVEAARNAQIAAANEQAKAVAEAQHEACVRDFNANYRPRTAGPSFYEDQMRAAAFNDYCDPSAIQRRLQTQPQPNYGQPEAPEPPPGDGSQPDKWDGSARAAALAGRPVPPH